MVQPRGEPAPGTGQGLAEIALTFEKGPVVSFRIKSEIVQAPGKLGESHLLRSTLMA